MKAVNEKITIELSIRELDLVELSLSVAMSEYWKNYRKAEDGSDDQRSYKKTHDSIDKLYHEISRIKYGD